VENRVLEKKVRRVVGDYGLKFNDDVFEYGLQLSDEDGSMEGEKTEASIIEKYNRNTVFALATFEEAARDKGLSREEIEQGRSKILEMALAYRIFMMSDLCRAFIKFKDPKNISKFVMVMQNELYPDLVGEQISKSSGFESNKVFTNDNAYSSEIQCGTIPSFVAYKIDHTLQYKRTRLMSPRRARKYAHLIEQSKGIYAKMNKMFPHLKIENGARSKLKGVFDFGLNPFSEFVPNDKGMIEHEVWSYLEDPAFALSGGKPVLDAGLLETQAKFTQKHTWIAQCKLKSDLLNLIEDNKNLVY